MEYALLTICGLAVVMLYSIAISLSIIAETLDKEE